MLRHSIATALLLCGAAAAGAQTRSDFHWDKALPAGNDVSIHNVNGNIKVVPSTNGHVEITGTRHGSSRYADDLKVDVHEGARGIDVCVVDDPDAHCGDNDGESHGRHSWDHGQIDLEVAVPANVHVDAGSVSGDVTITGAHGDLEVSTVSGEIRADQLHVSSLRAHSVSGDVNLRVAEFTGRGDLSFNSVSGTVTLEVPRDFAADLSLSTVSGDIDSDFPITLGGRRMSRRSLNAKIGGGGRQMDVHTVSGDLRLRMSK